MSALICWKDLIGNFSLQNSVIIVESPLQGLTDRLCRRISRLARDPFDGILVFRSCAFIPIWSCRGRRHFPLAWLREIGSYRFFFLQMRGSPSDGSRREYIFADHHRPRINQRRVYTVCSIKLTWQWREKRPRRFFLPRSRILRRRTRYIIRDPRPQLFLRFRRDSRKSRVRMCRKESFLNPKWLDDSSRWRSSSVFHFPKALTSENFQKFLSGNYFYQYKKQQASSFTIS